MDPVTMMMVGTMAAGGGSALGAVGQYESMRAQAKAGQQQAKIEGAWADRRGKEEVAAAQRNADARVKEGDLAKSRLQSLSAASGSGATDPTVMNLFGGIEKEAQLNAENETAAGQEKAAGLKYGADLSKWAADANANIKNAAANTTLIGGLLGSAGQGMTGYGRMATRYGYSPTWQDTTTTRYVNQ